MKRILALMLSVAMVLCMMPTAAFAAGEGGAEEAVTFSFSKDTVQTSKTVTYSGQEQVPVIYMNDEETTVESINAAGVYSAEWTQSEASDASFTNAGTYTLTVMKKSDSTEVAKLTYTINPKPLTTSMFSYAEMQTIKADFQLDSIKDGTNTLTVGQDFTLPTDLKIKEGLQTVKVEGKGNYIGTILLPVKGGYDIDTYYTLKIKEHTAPVYTGSAVKIDSYISVEKKSGIAEPDATKPLPEKLTMNTDYTATYEDNVNAYDTPVIKIEGIGKFYGSLSATGTFDIAEKDINRCSITSPNNIPRDAKAEDIDVTIFDGSNKQLKKGEDYLLTVSGTSGDTATVIVEGFGNYNGSKVFSNVKTGETIIGATVTYTEPKASVEYTGSSIVATNLKVKLAGKELKLNTDYKVVYKDNTDVGTATMQIVGIGTYAGTIEETFQIIEKRLSALNGTISLSTDTFYYTGSEIEPSVTVTCDGRTLRKTTDYTVKYINNTRIGTATVYVYGAGNYAGSLSKTFKIVGKNIVGASVTLSETKYDYDGKEKRPAVVSVKDGTKTLTSGVDYTVAYKNNVNAGKGEVVITGKGNYSDEKIVTFTIAGKPQTVTTNYTKYSRTIDRAPFDLNAKHDGDGTLTFRSDDTSVATVSSKGIVTIKGTGVAHITVSVTGNKEYDPASKVVTVTVKPQAPASVKLSTPKTGQVKVLFDRVEGTTKYQVRYGRMGKYYIKEVTHKDNAYTRTYTTLKNRTKGKLYYIKVRAYKELADGTKIYGAWAPTQKIRAK